MSKIEELKEKGNELLKKGDIAGASAMYTEALSLCPEDDRHFRRILHSNRSAARLKAGDTEGALRDADACVELGPGWSKGLARRGAALIALGRFKEACKAYEQALLGDPANQSIQESLNQAKAFLAAPSSAGDSTQVTKAEESSNKTENDTEESDPLAALISEVEEIANAAKGKQLKVDHDKETAGWTGQNQVERILQKHFKFLNLNPFHVFGIAHHANEEDIRKRYLRLGALVHPDKNSDPRAREAFEFVTKAYNELKNDERRQLLLETFAVCRGNVEQARSTSLRLLGGNEELLIQREGTFDEALDKEIKKVLALNEQERLKAEKIRAANEEALARSQKAKEPNWGEFARQQDLFKEGTDERVKNWSEFTKNKRQKF